MKLAVPLTRRALARRSERIAALPFHDVEGSPEGANLSASSPPFAAVDAATVAAPILEEGSADPADEPDVQPPRRRPPHGEAAAPPPSLPGPPVDLIAGEPTDIVQESADPLLPAPEEPPAAGSEEATASTSAPPPGQALVAHGEECLRPTEVRDADGDFRRNSAVLSDLSLCVSEVRFEERKRPWVVQTIDSGRPGPLWAVMHDDEAGAFDNAVYGLKTYGGVLVAVDTGGKRNQDGIDPNRNFSAAGIGCTKLGKDASPRFTELFRDRFDASQPIIALHNNAGGRIPTGGLGHVSLQTAPKGMRIVASSDAASDLADPHTLVLLASLDPESAVITRRAEMLSGKGINVVVEPVRKTGSDCSLSNDAVLSGHNSYYNVTVDAAAADAQRQIVDIIMTGPTTIATAR
jgi:hypothetical protein